ncbi:MAG: cation:proton antiporter [Opitutaceae bacterium]|nr:cation:proton antiporter [Opitutaceae bacterium]
MEGINLIQDLALVLIAAGVAGALCKRIGLSAIVGYLLAGILVGPYTPPFSLVLDVARIETLSQIGLVFLMFGIGLGLSLTKLRQMGVTTLIATGLGAFFVLNLTQLLGVLVGWTSTQSLFIAAMFMVSSSVVIAKVMQDLNLDHTRPGQLAVSVTVLEDVVAVVMLAVLAAQGVGGGQDAGVGGQVAGLGAFVTLLVCVGLLFIPRLLRRLETAGDPEIRTIIVAGVLFLMAILTVKAGYSLALGAFLLGAIVAEIPQKAGIERAFSGVRDMFSSVFFVAIGMMIDVRLFAEVWHIILGLGLLMIVLRTLACGAALIAVGVPPAEARRAGLALTPIGEFSFLIAQLGVQMSILPAKYYPVAVGVSILTVFLAPIINRRADAILGLAARLEPGWLTRALETYHGWLSHLGGASNRGLWWQLGRKRLLHIGLELLLITGLFSFSGLILDTLQRSPLATGLDPAVLRVVFWSVLGVIALVPFVAIWRNVSTLALIFGETARAHTRLPGPLVENGIKVIGALGLAYWISRILPVTTLPQWVWLVIGAVAAAVVAVFSQRLIYWHSHWQHSLSEVLEHKSTGQPVTGAAQRFMTTTEGWQLNVEECILPEPAACAGQTIAALRIRSRFNCTVVEIDRQGHLIVAPEPSQPLFSGDRLLLLGTPADIARARAELTRAGKNSGNDFDECLLETVALAGERHIGSTLAELHLPQQHSVLVVGIQRGGERIANPHAAERLAAGDHLLLLGTPERLRAVRQWLGGPPA